jgi:hypothetical protein
MNNGGGISRWCRRRTGRSSQRMRIGIGRITGLRPTIHVNISVQLNVVGGGRPPRRIPGAGKCVTCLTVVPKVDRVNDIRAGSLCPPTGIATPSYLARLWVKWRTSIGTGNPWRAFDNRIVQDGSAVALVLVGNGVIVQHPSSCPSPKIPSCHVTVVGGCFNGVLVVLILPSAECGTESVRQTAEAVEDGISDDKTAIIIAIRRLPEVHQSTGFNINVLISIRVLCSQCIVCVPGTRRGDKKACTLGTTLASCPTANAYPISVPHQTTKRLPCECSDSWFISESIRNLERIIVQHRNLGAASEKVDVIDRDSGALSEIYPRDSYMKAVSRGHPNQGNRG